MDKKTRVTRSRTERPRHDSISDSSPITTHSSTPQPTFHDLEQVKKLRTTLPPTATTTTTVNGSTSNEGLDRSILGRKGTDRYSIRTKKRGNLKSFLTDNNIDSQLNSEHLKYGPKRRKFRLKSSLLESVVVKRKYTKRNPFVPKLVPGTIRTSLANLNTTGREEAMGFDQYAKIIVPETEEDKAVAGYERYFEQTYQGGKVGLTSDNTLAQLQALEPQDLLRGITQAKTKLIKAIVWLEKLNSALFPQWKFELSQGFNLLFYGYGSKRVLLEKFAKETLLTVDPLDRNQVFVINGYFPDLTLRSIITRLTQDVLHLTNTTTLSSQKSTDVVEAIKAYFATPSRARPVDRLYLVIHNLDGENLRTTACQQFFSELCKLSQISVLASVDHIHGPLLWDRADLSGMNFIWHELATYSPYQAETSFESSPLLPLGANPGGQVSYRAVNQVLASVNDKAKGIFKLLLQAQIDADAASGPTSASAPPAPTLFTGPAKKPTTTQSQPDPSSDLGLTSDQLYRLSQKKFLTSSLPAFNANLREFLDHHLIKELKSPYGLRYHIPFPSHTLTTLLELEVLKNLP